MSITPDPNRVLLCDISVWQDNNQTPQITNFKKMKNEGVSGVIIKCGQNLVDPDFKRNWKESKGIFPRGSYWFYSSFTNPNIQAERWVEALDDDVGEFHLWLDLEAGGDGGKYGSWKNWYNLLERLKYLNPNLKMGIYTGYYYWVENSPKLQSQLDYFKQYPLWIATYGNQPLIPKPFEKELLWQFTDNLDGIKYGAESKELDGNYFNGTLEEFHKITNWNQGKNRIILNYNTISKVYEEVQWQKHIVQDITVRF